MTLDGGSPRPVSVGGMPVIHENKENDPSGKKNAKQTESRKLKLFRYMYTTR